MWAKIFGTIAIVVAVPPTPACVMVASTIIAIARLAVIDGFGFRACCPDISVGAGINLVWVPL